MSGISSDLDRDSRASSFVRMLPNEYHKNSKVDMAQDIMDSKSVSSDDYSSISY